MAAIARSNSWRGGNFTICMKDAGTLIPCFVASNVLKKLRVREQGKIYHLNIAHYREGKEEETIDLFNQLKECRQLQYLFVRYLENRDSTVDSIVQLIQGGIKNIQAVFIDSLTESHSMRLLDAVRRSKTIKTAYFGQYSYLEPIRKQIVTCVRGHISLTDIHTGSSMSLYPETNRYYILELLLVSHSKKSKVLVALLWHAKKYNPCLRDIFLRLSEYLPC